MSRRGVRHLPGRTMVATMKLIVKRCRAYSVTEGTEERSALVNDVWRYANMAIMQSRRKKLARTKTKKSDGRLKKIPVLDRALTD